MTPGVKVKEYKGETVIWKVPFYSELKKIFARNEEDARDSIYGGLTNKWIGFRMMKEESA